MVYYLVFTEMLNELNIGMVGHSGEGEDGDEGSHAGHDHARRRRQALLVCTAGRYMDRINLYDIMNLDIMTNSSLNYMQCHF